MPRTEGFYTIAAVTELADGGAFSLQIAGVDNAVVATIQLSVSAGQAIIDVPAAVSAAWPDNARFRLVATTSAGLQTTKWMLNSIGGIDFARLSAAPVQFITQDNYQMLSSNLYLEWSGPAGYVYDVHVYTDAARTVLALDLNTNELDSTGIAGAKNHTFPDVIEDGETLYVRLFSWTDDTYGTSVANVDIQVIAAIPEPSLSEWGGTLDGETHTFNVLNGRAGETYDIIFNATDTTAEITHPDTQVTRSGLPTDGGIYPLGLARWPEGDTSNITTVTKNVTAFEAFTGTTAVFDALKAQADSMLANRASWYVFGGGAIMETDRGYHGGTALRGMAQIHHVTDDSSYLAAAVELCDKWIASGQNLNAGNYGSGGTQIDAYPDWVYRPTSTNEINKEHHEWRLACGMADIVIEMHRVGYNTAKKDEYIAFLRTNVWTKWEHGHNLHGRTGLRTSLATKGNDFVGRLALIAMCLDQQDPSPGSNKYSTYINSSSAPFGAFFVAFPLMDNADASELFIPKWTDNSGSIGIQPTDTSHSGDLMYPVMRGDQLGYNPSGNMQSVLDSYEKLLNTKMFVTSAGFSEITDGTGNINSGGNSAAHGHSMSATFSPELKARWLDFYYNNNPSISTADNRVLWMISGLLLAESSGVVVDPAYSTPVLTADADGIVTSPHVVSWVDSNPHPDRSYDIWHKAPGGTLYDTGDSVTGNTREWPAITLVAGSHEFQLRYWDDYDYTTYDQFPADGDAPFTLTVEAGSVSANISALRALMPDQITLCLARFHTTFMATSQGGYHAYEALQGFYCAHKEQGLQSYVDTAMTIALRFANAGADRSGTGVYSGAYSYTSNGYLDWEWTTSDSRINHYHYEYRCMAMMAMALHILLDHEATLGSTLSEHAAGKTLLQATIINMFEKWSLGNAGTPSNSSIENRTLLNVQATNEFGRVAVACLALDRLHTTPGSNTYFDYFDTRAGEIRDNIISNDDIVRVIRGYTHTNTAGWAWPWFNRTTEINDTEPDISHYGDTTFLFYMLRDLGYTAFCSQALFNSMGTHNATDLYPSSLTGAKWVPDWSGTYSGDWGTATSGVVNTAWGVHAIPLPDADRDRLTTDYLAVFPIRSSHKETDTRNVGALLACAVNWPMEST
jgi:hypothetical protein